MCFAARSDFRPNDDTTLIRSCVSGSRRANPLQFIGVKGYSSSSSNGQKLTESWTEVANIQFHGEAWKSVGRLKDLTPEQSGVWVFARIIPWEAAGYSSPGLDDFEEFEKYKDFANGTRLGMSTGFHDVEQIKSVVGLPYQSTTRPSVTPTVPSVPGF